MWPSNFELKMQQICKKIKQLKDYIYTLVKRAIFDGLHTHRRFN